ncbi:MAG: response regulator transcription factor [Deltaproteobacteria bacterium]|nr:response regulator transcription factor [Deltaproteobacteria bacterium]
MVKILIADDHAVVRRGLKQIMTDEPDLLVVGEAQTAQQALELVRQQAWDVVVLDITMPGRSGLEVLKELQRERPKLPVLVLSMHPEEQFAVRALKAGAAGYLTKESAPGELVTAIRKVLGGGRYVSATLAETLAFELAVAPDQSPHETLSNREYEVFRLLAAGKTVSEIAAQLFLSVKTISTYRARILEKMNLKHNAELIRYAVTRGLV